MRKTHLKNIFFQTFITLPILRIQSYIFESVYFVKCKNKKLTFLNPDYQNTPLTATRDNTISRRWESAARLQPRYDSHRSVFTLGSRSFITKVRKFRTRIDKRDESLRLVNIQVAWRVSRTWSDMSLPPSWKLNIQRGKGNDARERKEKKKEKRVRRKAARREEESVDLAVRPRDRGFSHSLVPAWRVAHRWRPSADELYRRPSRARTSYSPPQSEIG